MNQFNGCGQLVKDFMIVNPVPGILGNVTHTAVELVDAEARLRDDVSLESFIAGFRLASGIAHELGTEPPYSFRQEEERRISGA